MKFRFVFVLSVVVALAACSNGGGPEEPPAGGGPEIITIDIPGFPRLISPPDNPLTREGIALGRLLFYDPILSGDSTQSCGSCHIQSAAFGDTARFSIGIDDIRGTRQAPTIINAGWLNNAFWDGRVTSLEDQAREPVPNEIEMNLPWPQAVARIKAHPTYPAMFEDAFPGQEITQDLIVKAIAQFERTFISSNSPWDRFLRDGTPLDPVAEAGRGIFFTETGDCFHCHGQVLGFDRGFHNTGLDSVPVDKGLGAVTMDPFDDGKFKSPALRNIMVSAPYMHDGRFDNIRDVIDHYNGGFHDGPDVDPLIRARLGPNRRLLRPGQIDTLIVFLEALTDSTFLNNPDLSNPFEQ